jgi:hypothetical protein
MYTSAHSVYTRSVVQRVCGENVKTLNNKNYTTCSNVVLYNIVYVFVLNMIVRRKILENIVFFTQPVYTFYQYMAYNCNL